MSNATSSTANVKPTAAGSSKASASGASAKSTTSTKGSSNSTQLNELVKTMEFKWFVAHALVVLNTLLSLVFFRISSLSGFTYRVAFIAAFASFAVILLQKYGKSKPSYQVLLREDNFQYSVATIVWLLTTRRIFALLPLAIFSFFHVLTYLRSYLLPALGHSADSALIKRIDNLVKNYNEPLTVLAANTELVLFIQLVLGALTFARGSWFQLIFYVAFFRIRYATSAYTRHAVKAWEIRADQLLGHPSLPPSVKPYWAQFKSYLARIPGPSNKA